MNCLCCTLCSFWSTLSLCLFTERCYSARPLCFISTLTSPRQVVRQSLFFFFLSLPSCEKSFYCRVCPNCVGRDECGDPNWNDLNHLFRARYNNKLTKVVCWKRGAVLPSKMLWCLTTFCCFLLWTGPHAQILYTGASQRRPPKACRGSCGQCRTVHEGFKPQSPCFLYGFNKNYACTGKESFGVFCSLDLQRRVGDH